VHYKLKQGVSSAQDDMKCDPNEQKPARPAAAAEHKHSAKNREKPNEANPDNVILKRMPCLELGEMVSNSDTAGDDEQATDDSD